MRTIALGHRSQSELENLVGSKSGRKRRQRERAQHQNKKQAKSSQPKAPQPSGPSAPANALKGRPPSQVPAPPQPTELEVRESNQAEAPRHDAMVSAKAPDPQPGPAWPKPASLEVPTPAISISAPPAPTEAPSKAVDSPVVSAGRSRSLKLVLFMLTLFAPVIILFLVIARR